MRRGWHVIGSVRGMATPDVVDEALASDLVDDPERSAAAEPDRAWITALRRRRWADQAARAGVTLAMLGSFIVLSRAIRGKGANAFDRSIVHAVGSARDPVGSAIMRGITFFGSAIGATAVTVTAVVLTRRMPRLVSQVASGALGGIVAELCLKRLYRRERPTLLPHLEAVTSTSFPSGHAMASSSLYVTLAFVASRSRMLRAHRTALLTGAGAFATMIGATRVYLGVHWPTDVLGGLALGTAWACAAETMYDLTGAERIEREAIAVQ
jgi:undecaprenyl-diphosphatase